MEALQSWGATRLISRWALLYKQVLAAGVDGICTLDSSAGILTHCCKDGLLPPHMLHVLISGNTSAPLASV